MVLSKIRLMTFLIDRRAHLGGGVGPEGAQVGLDRLGGALASRAGDQRLLDGGSDPAVSLIVLGVFIAASALIDLKLKAAGLTPKGWLALRAPLSIGLGRADARRRNDLTTSLAAAKNRGLPRTTGP